MLLALGAAVTFAAPNPEPQQAYGSVAYQKWKRLAEPTAAAAAAYPVQSVGYQKWKRHVEERDAQPDAAASAYYPVQSVSHQKWRRDVKREAAAGPDAETEPELLEVLTA